MTLLLYHISYTLSSLFSYIYIKIITNTSHKSFSRFKPYLWTSTRPLVPISLMRYRTYTLGLSTLSSSRGLTATRAWKSSLEVGFTLRCLQRLSFPNLATLPWHWLPTDTPAVRPSRSSRTKDSSSQISYAHNG